jgi:hypothetical protein
MTKLHNASVVWIFFLLITFFGVTPIFKAFGILNVLLFFLNVTSSALLLGLHWRMKQKLSLVWIVTHISFCYLVVFALLTKNVPLVGRFSEYLILANSVQFLLYCQTNDLGRELKILVQIALIVVCIGCITTLIGYTIDPHASRMVGDNPHLYASNIGGYGFVYSLIFFAIALQIMMAPGHWQRGGLFWRVLVFGLCVVTVISSRFLIGGILLVILLFFFYLTRRPPFHLGGRMLWILTGLIGISMVSAFAYWLYQNESYLVVKAFDILLTIFSQSDSGYLAERLAKYSSSVDGLIEFPVFGVLAGGGDVYGWQWYGRHSFILDNFALFGLFGGPVYLYILLAPWFSYRRRLGMDFQIALVGAATIFVLALTNILTPEILIAAYLILPATAALKNTSILNADLDRSV